MKPFTLLVKPASGLCNIDCTYCFYKRVLDELYPEKNDALKMSPATAEKMIRNYLQCGFPHNAICFQGGEPLLMGLDFYHNVIEYEKKYGKTGQTIGNSFQTNGLLITDEWARFFKQYNMLNGLSCDGPRHVHDHYRLNFTGKGTFDNVMKAADIMHKNGVEFNILSMITAHSVQHLKEIWSFFRENNLNFLQFIPCLEIDPKTKKPAEFSVTGEQYRDFHKGLFDLWFENGYPDVSIRLYDDILMYMLDGAHQGCCFKEACDSYFLIEHNGDVYPCDFFAYDRWKLGNINNDDYVSLAGLRKRHEFANRKRVVPGGCRGCEFIDFCRCDCPRFRLFNNGNPSTRSVLCPGFREFLKYSRRRFVEIKEDILRRRAEHNARMGQPGPAPQIPGDYPRNAPCPCGSGKKSKKCCGAK
ncbi:MAG: anaerobic sulfatase maturase [Chitinivibrionales bacterium]|nr:anaerobic sulfatase maturase [Chitinivibrionales bacterium]